METNGGKPHANGKLTSNQITLSYRTASLILLSVLTGLGAYYGPRFVEKQDNISDTLGEIKTSLGRIDTTLAEHGRRLGDIETNDRVQDRSISHMEGRNPQ